MNSYKSYDCELREGDSYARILTLQRNKEYSTEPGYLTKNDLTTDLNLTVIIKAACSPINGASSGVEDTND